MGIINKGHLLAQGTVKEIGERLQENLSILVTVDSDINRALEVISGLENVQDAAIADVNHISLSFTGSRELAGRLLDSILAAGVKVRWFEENEANLENVFINITSASGGKAE